MPDSSVRALSLWNKHLGRVPDEVWQQTELESLVLAENDLSEVPEKIGKLKKLRLVIWTASLPGEKTALLRPQASYKAISCSHPKVSGPRDNYRCTEHMDQSRTMPIIFDPRRQPQS